MITCMTVNYLLLATCTVSCIFVIVYCIQLCINRPLLNYQNLSIPLRLRGVK